MASSNEITQIKSINTELTSLNSTLQLTSTNYLTLVKNIQDGNQKIKDAGLSFDNLSKAQKETKKTNEELDKIGKQLQQSEQRLKELEDERTKAIIRNTEEIKKRKAAITEEVTGNKAAAAALRNKAKEEEKAAKEAEKAAKKEKELIDALKLEVKTEEDIEIDHSKEELISNIKDFATIVWFHGGGLKAGNREI